MLRNFRRAKQIHHLDGGNDDDGQIKSIKRVEHS